MINQVRNDSTIGVKKLSLADLGKSPTSNLTHIGLFDGTLNFLNTEPQIIPAQLIYANKTIDLLAILDFIKNPDGSFRSPKVRLGNTYELEFGGKKINSVVREIREITENDTRDWYLLWFGIDTNELVFFLFNNSSNDFDEIENIIGDIGLRQQIPSSSSEFGLLINYLNDKVENVNLEYYQELEIALQTGTEETTKRIIPRIRDIERANKLFKDTGLKGEQLLNQYLLMQKENNNIKDFKWLNASRESGLPYDFEITSLDKTIKFSDAKSTSYKFELPIILSSSELKFINDYKDNYQIHRLYSINSEPKMRICENFHNISDIFIPDYEIFNNSLRSKNLTIRNLNLIVPTNINSLHFEDEIRLNANA